MPTKQVKQTIGLIKCPLKNHNGEVRKQVNGLLYYQCLCGKMTPNRPEGQRWIYDNARLFTPEQIEEFNSFPKIDGLSVALETAEEKTVNDPIKEEVEKKADPKKEEPTRSTSPLDPEPVTDNEKKADPTQEKESNGLGMQF